jgi:hypothetical protein
VQSVCGFFKVSRAAGWERLQLLYGAKKYMWCALCVRPLLAVQQGVRIRPNANYCTVVGHLEKHAFIIGLPLWDEMKILFRSRLKMSKRASQSSPIYF